MIALGSRVIVRVDKSDTESKTGIKTGDKTRADRGTIVSLGHLVEDPALSVGVKVIFSEHAGKAETQDGIDYILLNYGELYSAI